MATKTKQWPDGSSATIQYGGQGDGEIIITSDPNSVYEARSMQITVETTDGSGIQKTITINQAAKQRIDLSAAVVTAATQTYSGSAKTPTPTVTLNGSTVPSSGYDVAYSNNTNAGTATITITGKGDYTGTATGTFTINKAAGVAGVSGRSLTYSRNAQNLVTVSGNTGTVHYRLGTSGSWSTSIPTSTNAGTYTIYYYVDASDNYNAVGSSSNPYDVSTTMAKRTPVLSVSPSFVTGLTYTGSAQNLLSGGAMKHSSSNSTVVAGTFSYEQQTNAETYTNPTWLFVPTDSTNYNNVNGSVTGSVTIAKANPTYTAPVAESLTYIGSSQFLITTGSTSDGTIQYSANGTSWSNTRPSGTNAGTYTAYWKLVGDSNHNDVASTQISNVGIAQKALTITAKAQSVTYGTAITQGTGQITISGLISGHSVTAISLAQSTTNVTTTGKITPSAATVKQSSTDVTANYDITYSTGNLTITAATPSYTAPTAKSNLTYSGSSQALVNAGSSSDGTFTYKLSTASSYGGNIPTGTNAGSYTVNWKFVADANHGGGTTTGNVSVTISQKSLTITAKAQSISYGNSIATGTSQVTTSGLVSGDSLTAITLTASTSNVTTSGTITPSAASTTKGISNYDVTYSTGNLTITAVPASVTAAPTAKTMTYSIRSQSLVNAGTASGGTMYYYATTTNSKPSSTSSFSSSIPSKTNAGTYYVWYYVKGDSNHTDTSISSTSVSVTISKATPVISTAPSKRTGLSYTGSAQNLLSGGAMKHSSSDSTSVGGTFTYAQGTNAGTYSSLTWSFAPTDSTNYNSTSGSISGSVSIAKANPVYVAPTANNRTYNTSSDALLVAGSNTTPGSFTYSSSQSGTYSSTIPSQTNAGTYTTWWKFTPTDTSNYNSVSATSISTTISPKTVSNPTITLSQSTYTYNGSAKTPTPTVKDGTVTISSSEYTVSYSNNTNAGTATCTITDKSGGNYTVSGSKTFTINKASRTLSFADSYVVLNTSSNTTKTATPSAGSGDGAITYSISSTTYATINSSTGKVTSKTSDGSATVTATIADGTNYLSASASYTLYVFATTHNYSYSGSAKSVTLPPGTYQFQCWGAQGASCSDGYSGGKGGYSVGQLSIANALAIQVLVGGQNGYNGGGSSTGSSSYNSGDTSGRSSMGNGGGASDIRLSNGALLSRMIVAGGGSGGAYCYKEVTSSQTVTITDGSSSSYIIEGSTYYPYIIKDVPVSAGNTYKITGTGDYGSSYREADLVWLYNNGVTHDISGQNYQDTAPSGATSVSIRVSIDSTFLNTRGYSDSSDAVYNSHGWSITIKHTETQTSVSTDYNYQQGYVGGGTTGAGYSSTYQGKQNAAGRGGSFGQGANQTTTGYRYCSGAGGGGWYGGGGGQKSDSSMTYVYYSGGGSGFVNTAASAGNRPSGYTGLELDSGTTYAGNTSFPSTGGGTETGHSGNGYVRITRL